MATIVFTSAQSTKTVVVAASDAEAPTLLAIALAHGVPVRFNCESGGCAACLVRVKEARGPSGREPAGLGEDEEFLLDAMGKLAPEDTGFVETDGVIERYRLACRYAILGDEDLVVAYDDSIGSR